MFQHWATVISTANEVAEGVVTARVDRNLPTASLLVKSVIKPDRLKSAATGAAIKNARVGLWIDKNFKVCEQQIFHSGRCVGLVAVAAVSSTETDVEGLVDAAAAKSTAVIA